MGTTPNYNLRYPEHPDTPDVPRDIKNLADDIDALTIHTEAPLAGSGTESNPLRIDENEVHVAVGTSTITNAPSGAHGSVAVTFPTGRFGAIPRVTATSATGVPNYRGLIGVSELDENGFVGVIMNSGPSDTDIAFYWHAIESSADSVEASLEGHLEGRPSALVTCPTTECANQGVELEMPTTYTGADGERIPVDGIQCGACQTDLTATQVPMP